MHDPHRGWDVLKEHGLWTTHAGAGRPLRASVPWKSTCQGTGNE